MNDGEGLSLALREEEAFFHRSAGALGCHTRIRAGFPRDVERVRKHPHLVRNIVHFNPEMASILGGAAQPINRRALETTHAKPNLGSQT